MISKKQVLNMISKKQVLNMTLSKKQLLNMTSKKQLLNMISKKQLLNMILSKKQLQNNNICNKLANMFNAFRIKTYDTYGFDTFRCSILILLSKAPENKIMVKDTIFDRLFQFINIWPLHQWVFSIITLILMYWLIGSWYNKKLAREGGWMSWKVRINMIIIDLLINLGLGVYYMGARDTIIGQIMFRCPIAISPLIFLVEFIIFVWYYKKYILVKDKDKKKN